MPKLRVHALAISLDGYVAGPDQDLEHPLGVGGPQLHEWVFATRARAEMFGSTGGDDGRRRRLRRPRLPGIGATVMGRNMFGPVRGPWASGHGGDDWNGWWGEIPPYHHPVFVLTHHARPPIEMEGGTTFHFVTDGIDAALAQAFAAADGADVRLGGGAATIQRVPAGRAGRRDAPRGRARCSSVRGERLFEPDDAVVDRYECAEMVPGASVVHVRVVRRPRAGPAVRS